MVSILTQIVNAKTVLITAKVVEVLQYVQYAMMAIQSVLLHLFVFPNVNFLASIVSTIDPHSVLNVLPIHSPMQLDSVFLLLLATVMIVAPSVGQDLTMC